jgi:hypothetical protein
MSGCTPNALAIWPAAWSSSDGNFRSSRSFRARGVVNRPTLRRPHFLIGAGPAVSLFPFPKEWSAGRRQGFARPLSGACEAPGSRAKQAGLRGPFARRARPKSGRFARPAGWTLRLPALHRPARAGPGSLQAVSPAHASGPPVRPACHDDAGRAEKGLGKKAQAMSDVNARHSGSPRSGESGVHIR